jgi:hypothetical protein
MKEKQEISHTVEPAHSGSTPAARLWLASSKQLYQFVGCGAESKTGRIPPRQVLGNHR